MAVAPGPAQGYSGAAGTSAASAGARRGPGPGQALEYAGPVELRRQGARSAAAGLSRRAPRHPQHPRIFLESIFID